MTNCCNIGILHCLYFIICSLSTFAEVRLPALISDNMVIQRDQEIPIWGWADQDEKVTIDLRDQSRSVTPDPDGKWKVYLDAMEAGGPYTLTVTGKNVITVKNVYVGEVWLCSGQSNMELGVSEVNNAEEEITSAHNPQIHFLTVPFLGTDKQQHDFDARWVLCSPGTVENFSAVAYFFGRILQRDLGIHIGLIHCSWGASSCEAWINREVLETHPEYHDMLKEWDMRMDTFDLQKVEKAESDYASWWKKVKIARSKGLPTPKSPFNKAELFRIMFPPRRCPSYCYNGMLSPVIPYSVGGVIWYQGETNVKRAHQYRKLFPLLIQSWREEWNQGDFPFIFVQLAGYRDIQAEPGPSEWAELREAQTMALQLPNTGMAVTIDIGDAKSQHPKNKQDVGKRLALWALANVYNQKTVYSGPIYKSMEQKGREIILRFNLMGSGLISKENAPLKGFAIAGINQKFAWGDARIAGNKVIVSSPEIADPVAVRYGWADNPVCNLYNREGLPASPFRTDSWQGITE